MMTSLVMVYGNEIMVKGLNGNKASSTFNFDVETANSFLLVFFSSYAGCCLHCFAGSLVPSCRKLVLVLGNVCERLCTSRPLLGSYIHQESI